VYGWQPNAISLGWNQSLDPIDQVKAETECIDVVRRPTGGRAILHSEELTYSVVMRVKGKNVLSVYDDISRAIVTGLLEFNIPIAIEKNQPVFSSLYKTTSGAICFSSAGRYEIKYYGKKLVGSAQRRYAVDNGEEVVLQHGSVLLGPDHKRIVNFLKIASEEERELIRNGLEEKTTDLSSILNRKVTFREAADMILLGFKKAWSITPELIDTTIEKQKVIL
jgi:lipoate-protein ligase A